MRNPTGLWFRLLAAVTLLTALPAPAAAQTTGSVVVNQTKMDRVQPDRPVGQLYRWINRDDCLADDVLTFYTNVSPVNNSAYNLEVWAGPSGTDCTQAASRGVAANTCWLVYRAIPNNTVYPVNIRARDIVAQNYPSETDNPSSGGSGGTGGSGGGTGSGGDTGSGGTASGGSTSTGVGVIPGTAADCDSNTSSTGLTLFFMMLQGTQVSGTTGTWTQTAFDVAPPDSPTDITVESGENRLQVKWSATSPSDLREWRFYCDPPPGQQAVLDAGLINSTSDFGFARQALEAGLDGSFGTGGTLGMGGAVATGGAIGTGGDTATGGNTASGGATGTGGAIGTGGTDAGGVPDAGSGGATGAGAATGAGGATGADSCLGRPSELVSGTVPSERYRCGTTTGPTQRTGYAEGLANNTKYAVGMVGVDTVGNVGKLSEIECGAPVLHTDFFELYKKFGGKGGGGICSISRGGELAPAVGLGALSLVGLGFLRRRKRND